MNDLATRAAVVVRLEAEAARAAAEARKATAEAGIAEVQLGDARRRAAEEAASDDRNLTYVFSSQVTEASVQACADRLSTWHRTDPGEPLTIVLDSPGGDVVAGMALFDHILWLRREGHVVTVVVRGVAASMAGILLQAATRRVVGREAWVLIHRAAFGAVGKSFEVEDRVEWVKRVESRIIDIFTERAAEARDAGTAKCPLTRAKIRKNWERKDWWLSSDECIAFGVADEVR